MKRLMIVMALLTATTTSIMAQVPAADDPHHPPQTVAPAPPTAMLTNCAGNQGSPAAQNRRTNCPMAPGDIKSDQGVVSMQGMSHGQAQSGPMQAGQMQGGTMCCGSSNPDKAQ